MSPQYKVTFMPRDNFAPDIKRKLAERAGYLCSICNTITVGPSGESNTSVNLTGVAAHITAASSEGKRYDSKLTPESRASIDNGIWLCNTHADLIDGDEVAFTVDGLKLTKKNHEEKIKFKQSGINVEKGIITKIELANIGKITNSITLEFTDRNVIYGNNGVGKTLICEFIAALTEKKYLDRWIDTKRNENSLCNIYYFRNQLDKFSIVINHNNKILYFFNDSSIPLLMSPINIFYLKESFSEFLRYKKDKKSRSLVNLLSEYFNLSEAEFINVIDSMVQDKKFLVNDISLNKAKDDLMVKMNYTSNVKPGSFKLLSGGEKDRAILEITLKIVSYYSKFNTTILLIEHSSLESIDSGGVNCLFEALRKEELDFQFFFTTILGIDKLNTKDFKVYELVKINTGQVVAR